MSSSPIDISSGPSSSTWIVTINQPEKLGSLVIDDIVKTITLRSCKSEKTTDRQSGYLPSPGTSLFNGQLTVGLDVFSGQGQHLQTILVEASFYSDSEAKSTTQRLKAEAIEPQVLVYSTTTQDHDYFETGIVAGSTPQGMQPGD